MALGLSIDWLNWPSLQLVAKARVYEAFGPHCACFVAKVTLASGYYGRANGPTIQPRLLLSSGYGQANRGQIFRGKITTACLH